MDLNNPNSSKVNFSPKQEITSSDLNKVSSLLHKLFKDFTIQALQESQDPTNFGCIVSGCGISLTGGPSYNIYLDTGVVVFNTSIPGDYTGTLVNTPSDLFAVTLPMSGSDIYYIDLAYSEILDPATSARRVFDTVNNIVIPASLSVSTVPQVLYSLVPAPSTGPATGYVRLAQVEVFYDATVSVTYVTPRIWDAVLWPGTPNTFDSDQIKTLADSIATIKAQLKYILGAPNEWYSVAAADLPTLATMISILIANINALTSGFKSVKKLTKADNGSSPYVVPTGIHRILVKMWGGGGGGGATLYLNAGGRGGAGAYLEHIFNVTPGQTINFSVGSGGPDSTNGTSTSFGPVGGVTPVAGFGGHGGIFSDTDGTPGTVSGGSFEVMDNGRGVMGGVYHQLFHPNENTTRYAPNGFAYYGGGGLRGFYTGSIVTPSPGFPGGDGLILIYGE
ncbi:Uncharacterised protein [uncultured archaeon]|nr:Uncharacterised protein [uncultured archaeon]